MKDLVKFKNRIVESKETEIEWTDHCSDWKYMSEIDPEEREQMELEADSADDKRTDDMRYEEEERELIDQENEYIEQKRITDRESREKEREWEADLAEQERRAAKDSSHY